MYHGIDTGLGFGSPVDAISVDRSLPLAAPRSLGAIGGEVTVVSLSTDGVGDPVAVVVSSNSLTPAAISTGEDHDEDD